MNIRLVFYTIVLKVFLSLTLALDLTGRIHKRNEFLLTLGNEFFSHKEFENALINAKDNISEECFNDIQDLFKPENWKKSAEILDSWADFPSGLLYGHASSFGNFDECQKSSMFSNKQNKLIEGDYILINAYHIEPPNTQILSFGICLPRICESADAQKIFAINFFTASRLAMFFNKKTENNSSQVNSSVIIFYATKPRINAPEYMYRSAYLGAFIVSLLLIFVLLSTLYEAFMLKINAKPNELFKSFSVISNLKFIFRKDRKENDSGKYIECVDGIRSINLIWNAFGHAYMWSHSKEELNGLDREEWLTHLYANILVSANINVDTFLLLTGFLITWICFNKLEKNGGGLNKQMMFFHRFLRLTPAFAFTLLFASGIYPFLGSGPIWNAYVWNFAETCHKGWWRALFYISNYVNPKELCIGNGWYLATDMQLFILLPFIINGLLKYPKRTTWILVIMILLSSCWSFNSIMSIESTGFAFDNLMNGDDRYMAEQFSTHMRMGPWIIGVFYGFYMFKHNNAGEKLNQYQILLGWTLSLTIILLVAFGPYHLSRRGEEASCLEAAIFEAFARTSWAIAVGWIIFACHMGYGKSLNSFLSHPFWQPISRLNYATFLVKTFIDMNSLGLQKTASHYSDYDIICMFWSNFGISLTFALFLVLMVELPFSTIENYYLRKFRAYKVIL